MKPTHITIHHSLTEDRGTVSWDAIRRYHTHDMGWADIGYHYGIELIGDRYEILLGRMINIPGAHCKEQEMNKKSIGICLVGNFDNEEPGAALMTVLRNLVKSLMEVLRIPVENIHMHREFAPYKSCPGKMFPWDEFIKTL